MDKSAHTSYLTYRLFYLPMIVSSLIRIPCSAFPHPAPQVPLYDSSTAPHLSPSTTACPDPLRYPHPSLPSPQVHIYDVAAKARVSVLEGHTDDIQCLSFEPQWADGVSIHLLTGDSGGSARLWSVSSSSCTAVGRALKGREFGGTRTGIMSVALGRYSRPNLRVAFGRCDGTIQVLPGDVFDSEEEEEPAHLDPEPKDCGYYSNDSEDSDGWGHGRHAAAMY